MRTVLFVCTGNATRSVIAGALARRARPEWTVRTGGTMSIEGLPISIRTRAALESLELTDGRHRSRQLVDELLEGTDLVVCMENHQVEYIRRRHPDAAARTANLRRLVRDLPATDAPLEQRVAALGLADVTLEPWEEVADPEGSDADVFVACAGVIRELMDELVPRLD